MATANSLAIRQDAAWGRIQAALAALGNADSPSGLEIRHRDPYVQEVLRVEAIADALGAIISAPDEVAETSAVKGAKAQADAPLTVETVEIVDPKAKAKK